MVQTQRAGAGCDEVEEEETKHEGDFPSVADGKEISRQMSAKIGYGHFAAYDECRHPRKQADEQQRPARNLQHSSNTEQRKIREARVRWTGWETKQLLTAVLEEQKRSNDPENAEQIGR